MFIIFSKQLKLLINSSSRKIRVTVMWKPKRARQIPVIELILKMCFSSDLQNRISQIWMVEFVMEWFKIWWFEFHWRTIIFCTPARSDVEIVLNLSCGQRLTTLFFIYYIEMYSILGITYLRAKSPSLWKLLDKSDRIKKSNN